MNTFKCVKKCFHKGRLYEVGETYKDAADAVIYFEKVDDPGDPVKLLRKSAKTKKDSILS